MMNGKNGKTIPRSHFMLKWSVATTPLVNIRVNSFDGAGSGCQLYVKWTAGDCVSIIYQFYQSFMRWHKWDKESN